MWCSPYKRCTISDSVARARVEMSRVPRLRIAILAILARIAFDHACGEQRTVEEKRGVFIEGEREQRWERNLSASMSQRHNVIDRGSGRFRSDAFFFTTAIVATVLYRMLFGQIGATVVSLDSQPPDNLSPGIRTWKMREGILCPLFAPEIGNLRPRGDSGERDDALFRLVLAILY